MQNILKGEGIMSKIHALSLKTDTIEEYKQANKNKPEEMPCRGGSKYEKKQKEKSANSEDRQ